MRLDGKIAIVLGAAGAVGRTTALRFAQEGAKVVVSDSAPGYKETAQAIIDAGGESIGVKADVTKSSDLSSLALRAEEAFGLPTVICNCASLNIEQIRPLADILEAEFRAALDVNVKGAWLVIKHLAPAMIEAGGGSIVTIGSAEAFISYSTAGYVAANAAVTALTRNAAVEMSKYGIRVNLVSAGMTETAQSAASHPEIAKRTSVMERMATPTEVANMALFLASDEASYSTGSAFMVDGGWLAIRPSMSIK